MINEKIGVKFQNLVKITDVDTGEVLLEQCNDVHPQNLARVIARGLAGELNGNIYKVGIGNGGTYIDSVGVLQYQIPNTVGINATLYNETYSEVVDGTTVNGNSVISTPSLTDVTSLVTITMIIGANEPAGQWSTDTNAITTPDNPLTGGYLYEFDELGCFAQNPLYAANPTTEPEYLLLTHLVFHPMAKTQNRQMQLTYTLTISVS